MQGAKATLQIKRKGIENMKKKYYLTLDTETATLPFVNELCKNEQQKKKIAIAKPLIYDIGWIISDRQGNIIKQVSYLIDEIFFVPQVFNTAYYKNKRNMYLEKLNKGEISTCKWWTALQELENDLQTVDLSTAYNACFDFKKAIPFTQNYITHLYGYNFAEWEQEQKEKCKNILYGSANEQERNPDYLKSTFELHKREYPICDLWGLSCEKLLNNRNYKKYCLKNKRLTTSGIYFSTSAESAFQYLTKNTEFAEEHTALEDARIECQILTKMLKKGKVPSDITPFPFRKLGDTIEFVKKENKPQYTEIVINAIEQYLTAKDSNNAYNRNLQKKLNFLQKTLDK